MFRGGAHARSIDRITTLTALDEAVIFRDNKEGVLGLRVARALEQPADKAGVFTDAAGKRDDSADPRQHGVTGSYTSSEGLKGDAVWGTRGKLDDAERHGRIGAGHDRDPRPSLESDLPDLLARARLRSLRGEPARAKGLQGHRAGIRR